MHVLEEDEVFHSHFKLLDKNADNSIKKITKSICIGNSQLREKEYIETVTHLFQQCKYIYLDNEILLQQNGKSVLSSYKQYTIQEKEI